MSSDILNFKNQNNPLSTLILVFAKTPVLGTVKTRLAKSLGSEKTLWVYKALLKQTDNVLQKAWSDVVVFYTGDSPSAFETCFQNFQKRKQEGKDLGERMESAFNWGFSQGYAKIVLIGTDLWNLHLGLLEGAFSAMDATEVVFGPAKDGGYYLLGLKEPHPELFKNKIWSGPKVLKDSILDLKTKSIALLEEKSDIDLYKDLVLHLDLLTQLNEHFDEREN